MSETTDGPDAFSQMPPGRFDTSYLDAIRGFAAFWVLTAHCAIWTGTRGLPIPDPKIAVDIFMVLSGFLIMLHASERRRSETLTDSASLKAFYIRRIFRIAPSYYVTLAMAIVFGSFFTAGYYTLLVRLGWDDTGNYNPAFIHYTPLNAFMNLTFLSGLVPSFNVTNVLPDWSISLEMQFYAVFPLLLLLFRRFGFLLTSLALSAACLVAYSLFRSAYPEPAALPFKLPYFLIGMLICEVGWRQNDWKRTGLLLGVIVLLSLFEIQHYGMADIWLWGTIVLMTVLWVPRLRARFGFLRGLLGNRFTREAARLSFAVYLVHGFFIASCGAVLFRWPLFLALPPLVMFLITWFIVMTGAYTTAWFLVPGVEAPGIAWGRRLAAASKR